MRRDPQLIRQILLKCEEHEHGFAPWELSFDGYSEEVIGFHVHLIGEAGYMKIITRKAMAAIGS